MLFLQAIQLISAIFLVIFILAQSRSTGLGVIAGSSANQVFSSRRGIEKVIFNITIIFTIVFIASSIAINIL